MNKSTIKTFNHQRLYLLVILLVFIPLSTTLSQLVNFPLLINMKSGDHKLLFATITGAANFTYTQPTTSSASNYTANPFALISIRDLKIDQTTRTIDYYIYINASTITRTSFIASVQIRTNVTFTLLYYHYLTFGADFLHTFTYFYSIDTNNYFNGTIGLTNTYPKTITQSITSFAKAKVSALISSFSIQDTRQYSFSVSASMTNLSTVNIKVSSNSSLFRIDVFMVIVDEYSYEIRKTSIYDEATYYSYNSGNDTRYNLRTSTFNYFNYIIGLTDMRISADQGINFYVTPYNNIETQNTFIFIQYKLLHWRQSQCINNTMPYFSLEELRCYDNCSLSTKNNYGTNTTYNYCQKCSYYCQSCKGDGISCLTCSSSSNRTLNAVSLKCQCLFAGTYDNGIVIACLKCIYSCVTCSSTESTCLTCDSTRNIQNSSCNCKTGTYDDGLNNSVCLSCDSNCFTCQITAKKCLTCLLSSNRILDEQSSTCICRQLFEDNGTQCILNNLICTAPCQTCQKVSTNCTSCFQANKRTLSNNRCICMSGYSQLDLNICTETCGDGRIMENTTQCDDGNTNNGDGCSSICKIEAFFNCTNLPNMSSYCLSTIGYTVTVLSLIRDPFSNDATLQVILTPTYSNTSVSLSNMQEYLDITSQTNIGNIFTLNLKIKKEISQDQLLKLGFTNINPTGQVPMKESNRLDLRPYESNYISIIKATHYLVIIYPIILWIVSLFFLIKFEKEMIGSILEYFMINALTWIAVEGQYKYSLILEPIRNLKYIFIYNMSLSDSYSLFSQINVGFLYNITPLVIFFTLILLNRLKLIHIEMSTKRFLLYDCGSAMFILNGVLIFYGLELTTQRSSLNVLSSVGIAIFIIYFLILVFISWRFLVSIRDLVEAVSSFQYIKSNYLNPKVIPFHYLLFYLIIFTYLRVQSHFLNNVVILMIYSLVVIAMFYKFNFIINKFRFLGNFIILFIIFNLILLLNNVSAASWVGLTIVIIIYCQLILNFIFIYNEKYSKNIDFIDQLSERDQLQKIRNIKQGLTNNNQDISVDNEHYRDIFQVYNPQIKSSVKGKQQKSKETVKKDQQNEFSQRFPQSNDKKIVFLSTDQKLLNQKLLYKSSSETNNKQVIEMIEIQDNNLIQKDINGKGKEKSVLNESSGMKEPLEVKKASAIAMNEERPISDVKEGEQINKEQYSSDQQRKMKQQNLANDSLLLPKRREGIYEQNEELLNIDKMKVDMNQI